MKTTKQVLEMLKNEIQTVIDELNYIVHADDGVPFRLLEPDHVEFLHDLKVQISSYTSIIKLIDTYILQNPD